MKPFNTRALRALILFCVAALAAFIFADDTGNATKQLANVTASYSIDVNDSFKPTAPTPALAVLPTSGNWSFLSYYDIKAESWQPVAAYNVKTFDNLFGQSWFDVNLVLVGGATAKAGEPTRGLIGTGAVLPIRASDNVTFTFGGVYSARSGRSAPSFGLIVGAAIKF